MTIAQILNQFPEIESEILLAHVLKQNKEFLYLHGETHITQQQLSAFKKMAKLRLAGLPIAYVTGIKYFYGLPFKVNRDVLIPRPETEWLVERSIRIINRKLKSNPRAKQNIIDVGTGSGCIAISLSKHIDQKYVGLYASDISEKALAVAKKNATTHNVSVSFSHASLLEHTRRKFDLIIANLPYVPASHYIILKEGLKYEPKHAITDGTDTFILITHLLKQAATRLQKDGVIVLETDPSSIKIIKNTAKQYFPKQKLQVFKDLKKVSRYIMIS